MSQIVFGPFTRLCVIIPALSNYKKLTKLDFWKAIRGDADKMQMLMCVKLKVDVCACARAMKGFVHTSIGFVLLQNV